MSILLDAGPCLNFLAVGQQNVGRRRARIEQVWLNTLGASGTLTLWNTPRVLQDAAREEGWIGNGLTWEAVYDQMRDFDDGLPPRPS